MLESIGGFAWHEFFICIVVVSNIKSLFWLAWCIRRMNGCLRLIMLESIGGFARHEFFLSALWLSVALSPCFGWLDVLVGWIFFPLATLELIRFPTLSLLLFCLIDGAVWISFLFFWDFLLGFVNLLEQPSHLFIRFANFFCCFSTMVFFLCSILEKILPLISLNLAS